jgi:hypothetical protein
VPSFVYRFANIPIADLALLKIQFIGKMRFIVTNNN